MKSESLCDTVGNLTPFRRYNLNNPLLIGCDGSYIQNMDDRLLICSCVDSHCNSVIGNGWNIRKTD